MFHRKRLKKAIAHATANATCRFRSVDASEFEETVGGEVLWMGFLKFELVTVYFFSLVTVFSLRILFGTMVNPHKTIIWENMFQLFPSIKQAIPNLFKGYVCLKSPRHAFPHINCLEVMEPP